MDLSIFFLATLLEYKLHVFKPCNSITCIPMYTPLGVSLVAQTVKSLPAMQAPGFNPWIRKIPWRRAWQSTPVFLPGLSHRQRSLVGTVHGVAKSRTQLKRQHNTAHILLWNHPLKLLINIFISPHPKTISCSLKSKSSHAHLCYRPL